MYDNKINSTSIGMLIITALLLVILAIAGIALHNARTNNNYDSLPELEVIEDRTSTTATRTTTSTTRSTEVIVSPYYTFDTENYLTDEIYTQKNRKSNASLELIKSFSKEVTKIFDTDDMSIINTEIVIKYAKDDEKDHIVTGGNDYAIIYDSNALFEKLFTKKFISEMIYYKYDNKPIFVIYRDNYYRLASLNLDPVRIQDTTLVYSNMDKLTGNIKYKRENGSITLIYEDDRWKIDEFNFPGYTKELPQEEPTTEEGE